ncbi:hypothetical protein JMJ77_0000420, partial [Colletotrichum scovillei]
SKATWHILHHTSSLSIPNSLTPFAWVCVGALTVVCEFEAPLRVICRDRLTIFCLSMYAKMYMNHNVGPCHER